MNTQGLHKADKKCALQEFESKIYQNQQNSTMTLLANANAVTVSKGNSLQQAFKGSQSQSQEL
jgi:hypothetical protein